MVRNVQRDMCKGQQQANEKRERKPTEKEDQAGSDACKMGCER